MQLDNQMKSVILLRAIEQLRMNPNTRFSCNAIQNVAFAIFGTDFPAIDAFLHDYREYTWSNSKGGKAPYWWNSGINYRGERIAAMENFRDSLAV